MKNTRNRMKISTFTLFVMGCIAFSSCVTMGKYESLEATLNTQKKEHAITRQELLDLKDEYAALQRQFQQQTVDLTDVTRQRNEQSDSIIRLRAEMSNLQLGFDTVVENYTQKLSGTSRSLQALQSDLQKREQTLQSKQAEFDQQQAAWNRTRQEMEARYAELQKTEELSRKALAAKEQELEALRSSVTNALVGFKDKGLNVEVKDGKVYVSMESKLMFPSGSWTVGKEGIEAIRGLAKVLEENRDLNIMVEGHTDNVAYKGGGTVNDNWDLSVLRATSIVKMLLRYGPDIDPARIEACGHGEFAPKVSNDTPEHRAMNRRTEIILTPNLNALYEAVE